MASSHRVTPLGAPLSQWTITHDFSASSAHRVPVYAPSSAPPDSPWPRVVFSSPPRRPSFFLVGAPKAGTTAMNNYLARHPEICMAKKELHFFSEEVFFGPCLEERNLTWYLNQFSGASDKKLLGEASVFYLSSNCAAARIKEFDPRSKILIHVRNPSDLVISLHSEMLFQGFEDIENLEVAIKSETARYSLSKIPTRCPVPRVLYYSQIARQSAQIEHFFLTFGRENVLVNVFDDLLKDPTTVYKTTLAFLGVDPAFGTNFDVINSNKVCRSRFLRHFLREPPKHLKHGAKLALAQPTRNALREWLWSINTRYVQRGETNPAVQAYLKREFAGEVERLSALLGRDLTAWSR